MGEWCHYFCDSVTRVDVTVSPSMVLRAFLFVAGFIFVTARPAGYHAAYMLQGRTAGKPLLRRPVVCGTVQMFNATSRMQGTSEIGSKYTASAEVGHPTVTGGKTVPSRSRQRQQQQPLETHKGRRAQQ